MDDDKRTKQKILHGPRVRDCGSLAQWHRSAGNNYRRTIKEERSNTYFRTWSLFILNILDGHYLFTDGVSVRAALEGISQPIGSAVGDSEANVGEGKGHLGF